MVARLENVLSIDVVYGMYSAGSKIFSDGTIMHTLFLDTNNNPYISIKRDKANKVIQIFENGSDIHINVFKKNNFLSTLTVDYFSVLTSYSFNYLNEKISDVPKLYKAICKSITNICNKSNVKIVNKSETVLTFKELIILEQFMKKEQKLEINYGREIATLDTSRFSDIIALENAVIYQLDRMAV